MSDTPSAITDPALPSRPLLLVTEGVLDIVCLQHFSRIARQIEPALPDLDGLAAAARIVWLPSGGGDLAAWIMRLAPLACPEFHLYDQEQEPESAFRQRIVDQINARPNCRAVLTGRRSLENYLPPAAIRAVFGVEVEITDHTAVAELVARAHPAGSVAWPRLSYRARQRLIYRTKRRLNTEAVAHMTADLLAECDPAGEVIGWFRQIGALLSRGR